MLVLDKSHIKYMYNNLSLFLKYIFKMLNKKGIIKPCTFYLCATSSNVLIYINLKETKFIKKILFILSTLTRIKIYE